MRKETRIINLLHSLRYQYPSGVTTMGNCSAGCGKPARGSGICKACLTKELIKAGIDTVKLFKYRSYMAEQQELQAKLQDLYEELTGA